MENMEEKTIVLKRIDSIKLKLVTENGEPTGEYLYIKVKDIDAPTRFQKMIDDLQKIGIEFRDKINIIQKQQDSKLKGEILSKNQKSEHEALKEYFNKRIKVYNQFLGENGVQKLLNGQEPTIDVFDWIDEIIETQIAPHIDLTFKGMTDRIREKYMFNTQNEEVLE